MYLLIPSYVRMHVCVYAYLQAYYICIFTYIIAFCNFTHKKESLVQNFVFFHETQFRHNIIRPNHPSE